MQVLISINKVAKFGRSDGGDTIEVSERPQGGISIILADGQGSGSGAKRISSMIVNKAVSLIGDGARDGAVARTCHDYLYTLRHGKVSADLNIISIDLNSKTLVVSRNSQTPVLVYHQAEGLQQLNAQAPSIGVSPLIRPDVNQFPLTQGLCVALFSDGFLNAGGNSEQVLSKVRWGLEQERPLAEIGDQVFLEVLELASFRPRDDMSFALLALKEEQYPHRVKRYNLSFPL